MSGRVGKVLWATLKDGVPLPFLCVDANEDDRGIPFFVLLNLAYCEQLTIFVHDVDNLKSQELVRWDDE